MYKEMLGYECLSLLCFLLTINHRRTLSKYSQNSVCVSVREKRGAVSTMFCTNNLLAKSPAS